MSVARHTLPVDRIADEVTTGVVTAVTMARSAMASIVNGESGPERLNAFISFDYESAIEQARAVDARVAQGETLALAGVPVAIKDNICTTGLPTTCGSRILADFWAPYDATVVRRLRDAGAVIVGKTNLDEFAMGSSTETSALGPTANPHDAARVAGGSSGGSAAAVAAGLVPAALGSDTGGSVRLPAAFCGVVGVRPTYGLVSRYGLVAHASSLDQVGAFGARVRDAAHLLEVVAGPDAHDATCLTEPVPALARAAVDAPTLESLAGLTVGVPDEYFPHSLDDGVRGACDEALECLRERGARIRRVTLPHTRFALPAYYVIAAAEASANLARFDGVRYGARAVKSSADTLYEQSRSAGFGTEVKRRIVLGTFVLSGGYHEQYYDTARRVRTLVARDFAAAFDAGCDVLLTPTAEAPAFERGGKGADPYDMYRTDAFTVAPSLAGLPALSLPVGESGGLPVGAQLIAPRCADALMLRVAAALEDALST